MRTVSHLLFGNHPKAGRLKERMVTIVKIMKENGGRIEAKALEDKIGISRVQAPSMFYKPLAAMRRWNLLQTHKTIVLDAAGKKRVRTEYELTPQTFYDYVGKSIPEQIKKEIELA